MKTSLKKFHRSTCLKINIMSTLAFIILFSLSIFIIEMMFSQSKQTIETSETDNALGSFILMILLGLLVGLSWFIYSIAVPALMPLFKKFLDNIKSILGLLACNIAITFYLYTNFTIQLSIYYAVSVFLGILIVLYLRYNSALKFETRTNREGLHLK